MPDLLEVFTVDQIQQLARSPTLAIRVGFRTIEQNDGQVAPDDPDVANLITAAQGMDVITPAQATSISSGGTLANPASPVAPKGI